MKAKVITEQMQGSGKKPYDVTVYADGSSYCTCPSWRFQPHAATERDCKHTTALRAKYGLERAALTTDPAKAIEAAIAAVKKQAA